MHQQRVPENLRRSHRERFAIGCLLEASLQRLMPSLKLYLRRWGRVRTSRALVSGSTIKGSSSSGLLTFVPYPHGLGSCRCQPQLACVPLAFSRPVSAARSAPDSAQLLAQASQFLPHLPCQIARYARSCPMSFGLCRRKKRGSCWQPPPPCHHATKPVKAPPQAPPSNE